MQEHITTYQCMKQDDHLNISSLTQSLIYSILMSYCYFDRDTQNRGVDCHVLMNNNNPNLNAKYEETYKMKQNK